MAQPLTFDELRKKLLDQHNEQYVAFTRLILTLATGSFSLLAALSGNFLSSAQYVGLAKAALPLLLVSMLAGVLVQHRLMLRPLHDLTEAEKINEKATAEEKLDPVLLRRRPSLLERMFFRAQLWSFLVAFFFLAAYALLWEQ